VDDELDCSRWRAAVLETGNRAGLLLCGELRTAAHVVLRESAVGVPDVITDGLLYERAQAPGPLRDLLRFFVNPEHFALREILGTAAKS
jgi:hypothetical protein